MTIFSDGIASRAFTEIKESQSICIELAGTVTTHQTSPDKGNIGAYNQPANHLTSFDLFIVTPLQLFIY